MRLSKSFAKSFAMTALVSAFAVVSLTCAQAASRAFVSGKGTDSVNCGPIGSPCRTPQYAHDHIVAANGEIDILDPAGYGAITITKAISIINDGVGIAGFLATAGGNAITINAGASDTVVLRGLTIEGSGLVANGVSVKSLGTFIMSDCSAQGFARNPNNQNTPSGFGVLINPTSSQKLLIRLSHSDLSNNSTGFELSASTAPASVTIDNVIATNNGTGFSFGASAATTVTITNSIASTNLPATPGFPGGYLFSGTLTATLSDSYATGNEFGVEVFGGATLYLARSIITSNGADGVRISGGGIVNSYGDNCINGNATSGAGADVNGTLSLASSR